MIKGMLLVASLLLNSQHLLACDIHGTTGITVENNLYIGPFDKSAGGISFEEFEEAINEVEALYKETVSDLGSELKVHRNWDDGTVNAYAMQTETSMEVYMFGGLARHETITQDGFRLVVCHELGHHLGGAPIKISWMGKSWASNEGQADYWGTSKCFRKVLEKKGDSVQVVKEMKEVDPAIKKQCSDLYTNAEDAAICVRSAYAGKSLAALFHSIRSLTEPLSFTKKDPSVASRTYHGHPMPQCRLDTYVEAALCDIGSDVDTDMEDVTVGTCNRVNQDKTGLRPLCWFNPEEYK